LKLERFEFASFVLTKPSVIFRPPRIIA
jgi:hypothetical protein